jgi:hypothetical protein
MEADFDDFRIQYLGGLEAIFETALASESGKKIEDRKSRDTVPLRISSALRAVLNI